MNDSTREKLLKIALVAFGAIFFLIYPLGLFGRRAGCGTAEKANITCR